MISVYIRCDGDTALCRVHSPNFTRDKERLKRNVDIQDIQYVNDQTQPPYYRVRNASKYREKIEEIDMALDCFENIGRWI